MPDDVQWRWLPRHSEEPIECTVIAAEPEEEAPLCVHVNPNVLTRDIGTSSFAQGFARGCTGQLKTGRSGAVQREFAARPGV